VSASDTAFVLLKLHHDPGFQSCATSALASTKKEDSEQITSSFSFAPHLPRLLQNQRFQRPCAIAP